jgi:hypothetical protein
MTAAVGVSLTWVEALAGAPGFEPGIAGPKPAALPLGYAPIKDLFGVRDETAMPTGFRDK